VPAEIIDARGLKCPLPVLKAEKHLETLGPGGSFILIADDPIARVDIPLMCQKRGHDCRIDRDGAALRFTITRSAG
jgi:tRNA 2-thiouridine synthesizing protein A